MTRRLVNEYPELRQLPKLGHTKHLAQKEKCSFP
jgi:hypothetical protein